MKLPYTLVVLLLIVACNSKNTSHSETQNTPVLENTIASSFSTKDTIVIEALGDNMSEIRFNKDVITLPASQEITIALVNKSSDASMPHNFVVITKDSANAVGQNGLRFKDNGYINPADQNVIVHSAIASINETVYLSFKTPAAGEYDFICSFPGHWGMMKGRFITE